MGYDCPGGYIPWGGTWISDPTKLGAGGYPAGNPFANGAWGGGAGCHVDMTLHVIDQQNQDYSHLDFHADQGICWVSNIRDMINMQNWLFWKWVAGDWKQTQGTFSGTNPRDYMGWNEIPVDRTSVMDPSNWDSFLIKLPANMCGDGGGDDSIKCLQTKQHKRLETLIGRYVDQGYLMSGEDHAGSRPGSYAVVAREWQDSSGNWFRWFFCENW